VPPDRACGRRVYAGYCPRIAGCRRAGWRRSTTKSALFPAASVPCRRCRGARPASTVARHDRVRRRRTRAAPTAPSLVMIAGAERVPGVNAGVRCRARAGRRRRSSSEDLFERISSRRAAFGFGGPAARASGRGVVVARIEATTEAGSASSKNGSSRRPSGRSPSPITVAQYWLLSLMISASSSSSPFRPGPRHEHVGAGADGPPSDRASVVACALTSIRCLVRLVYDGVVGPRASSSGTCRGDSSTQILTAGCASPPSPGPRRAPPAPSTLR